MTIWHDVPLDLWDCPYCDRRIPGEVWGQDAPKMIRGWRCPCCGKGLAPQLTVCPCEGSDVTLKINHLERVIKRKIDWITMLEGEIVELRTAPHVSECSCVKAVRSGVLEDSLAWIYEDYTPPEA